MRPSLLLAASAAALYAAHTLVLASASSASASPTDPAAVLAANEDGKHVFAWWPLLASLEWRSLRALLRPSWWLDYIGAEFRAEPAHVIVEVLCIATILYLLLIRKPAPLQMEKLTKKEEEELIREWKPEPLAPVSAEPPPKTRYIVESVTGRTVQANGQTYLNFASTNFLGMADNAQIKSACRDTIDKYGVGSCGPRGFYGTFDVHLEIENQLAAFMRADEAILYSDAIACVSSVIPAFAKRGDTVVLDDACSYGIQQGALLSRSNLVYFKHGDMASLEAALKGVEEAERKRAKSRGSSGAAPTHRKFIVLEGVSSVYGDIAPLDRVLQLKHQFRYRLILDDSLGFGVLGAHGRGTIEHFNKGMQQADPSAEPGVDILCAALDSSLSSVGGFCVGNHQVVDHQRLSGAGYCFSASSPPYTSVASSVALGILEKKPELSASVRRKANKLRRLLQSAHPALTVLGGESSADSPVVHLALKRSDPSARASEWLQCQRLVDLLASQCRIAAALPEFIPNDRVRHTSTPNVKFVVTVDHSEQDLEKLAKAVAQLAPQVFKR